MKRLLLLCSVLLAGFALFAQSHGQAPFPQINPGDPDLPRWVRLMYAPVPNVRAVEAALDSQFQVKPFGQNAYTRYYKHWRRYVRPFTDRQGFVHSPTPASIQQESALQQSVYQRFSTKENATWSFAGPNVHYAAKDDPADADIRLSDHGNVYCIDRSLSDPNILFCGSEDGGIYKSTNGGQTWDFVSSGLAVRSVTAICIHPTNPQAALFCGAGQVFRTTDGGATWQPTGDGPFLATYIEAHEMMFSPTQAGVAFAATEQGFYRSADSGAHWTQVLPQISRSVAVKPGNSNIVYALQYNPATQIAELYKSTDGGQTFTAKTNGWFTVPPADAGKLQSYGGDIAVTEAAPDRVYVLMVGESQASANLQLKGTIGIFRSDDSGETWSHPHGQIGMPYEVTTHPNLMDFDGHSSTYHQIYYNTTLIASQLNPDRLLFGGLNTWRSDDGGVSYQPVGGYLGNLPHVHPDVQDFKVFRTGTNSEEVWCANDGGVNFSPDFYTSHESRCFGIRAGQWWGFDQGWNEDVMVGGRYHNGNGGHLETYPDKSFIALGGGEAPTGYANYSPERKVYASDIGGAVLPDSLSGATKRFAVSLFPNESYWEYNSSRMIFDWNYWDVCYLGKDNKLYISRNAGGSYEEMHAFGSASDKVRWIEQSRVNPEVIYVQAVVNNESQLWRTPDAGATWQQLPLPMNGHQDLLFSLSLAAPDELWIAFPYGLDGNKVFHTQDVGATWLNRTTPALDGLRISCIAHQGGTDGGVYLALKQAAVLYRNNTMNDWALHGSNLPAGIDPLRIVPFYRDNKLRFASWNMSIWEIPLYEPSALLADFSAKYQSTFCPGDTIFLTAHSVASGSAVYTWNCPGATPATVTGKHPRITYAAAGQYDITLTVNDNGQTQSLTKMAFIQPGSSINTSFPVAEGFETGKLNPAWRPDTEGWQVTDKASGYGQSTYSFTFDNFSTDLKGGTAEAWTERLDLGQSSQASLVFDHAYARYAVNYSDTLAVLVTTDCGMTRTPVFLKGGSDLATAPDFGDAVFVPTAAQWTTDTLDLSPFAGQSDVVVIFQNRGHWGQAMYVDNLNIDKVAWTIGVSPPQTAHIEAVPNPSREMAGLRWQFLQPGTCTLQVFNALGQQVWQEETVIPVAKAGEIPLSLMHLAPGVYTVKVIQADNSLTTKLIRE